MMHGDTMLKFDRLFDLAKYLEHNVKVSAYAPRYGRELIKFWHPLFISETNRARKFKFGTLVGIYEY